MKLPFLGAYKFPVYSYNNLAVQKPPEDLPQRIYIKTRTRAFCRLYYFALRDGQIWFKPNEEITGVSEAWSLFPPIGLSTNDSGDVNFEEPERIIEITADADELIVQSSWNHFYFIRFENQDPFVTDSWRDGGGVPPGRLALPPSHNHHRGYALGRRNKDVLYWEDPVGNPHHWGSAGISTLYVLSENGQEINIFDTGLPHDFSRQFGCPQRGRFIAENISASASTMFVIDKYGTMYTRLADFDTMGTNPMFFTYAYYDSFRPQDQGENPNTIFKPMDLPSEDWRKQPRIQLKRRARISRDITILQTGHGNAARELRVPGIDADGNTGYYWKPIFGEEWSFKKTLDHLERSRFLDPADLSLNKENLGPDQDLHFAGKMILGGRSYQVELPDFNMFCSPSRLRIHVGQKHFDLNLYSVDMWTWTTRSNPGRDGTPRIYLSALEISKSILQTQDRDIQELIGRHFLKHNLEPDAYVIRVSTNYLEMAARQSSNKIFLSCMRVGSSYTTPDHARAAEERMISGFLAQANDRSLVIDDVDALVAKPGHLQYLSHKIRLNTYTLQRLSAIMKVRRNHVRLQKVLAYTLSVIVFIAKIILIAYLPRLRTLSRIVPTLVQTYANTSQLLLNVSEQEFHAAKKILLERRAAYQSKLNEL